MSFGASPLEEVYREHFGFVWRALRRLGVREADVPDAVQDVFLVAHRRMSELTPGARMTTWLYAVALRVASDRRRRAYARREVLEEPTERACASADALHVLEARERQRLLEAVLDALPIEQRAVFTLFELDGLTGDQIAQLLDVPVATVHSRLRLAREGFRRALARTRQREAFDIQKLGASQ